MVAPAPPTVAWWNRAPPLPLPSEPLLDRLWARWVGDVPDAATFARVAGRFGNDHLALLTLARPGSGLAMFARVFERRGYHASGEPQAAGPQLRTALWAREGFARVAVTELDGSALPAEQRAALARLPADAPPPDDDDALAACPSHTSSSSSASRASRACSRRQRLPGGRAWMAVGTRAAPPPCTSSSATARCACRW